jgi:hypothetical protein
MYWDLKVFFDEMMDMLEENNLAALKKNRRETALSAC